MFFDVIGDLEDFMKNSLKTGFDWVVNLPAYQHVYNTTVHRSIGEKSKLCEIFISLGHKGTHLYSHMF